MIHLHVHSTFSFLDAYGTPEQIAERAGELSVSSIALTDHGSVSGHVRFWQACKEHNVKPVYGCEMYIVKSVENNQQRKGHVTILAKDEAGYQNLMQLVTLSNSEGHFYYRPTIDLADLVDHSEGLVVMTGCIYGLIPTMAREGHEDEAEGAILGLREVFGDDFYLEVQAFDLEDTRLVNKFMIRMSEKHGIPMVATGDVHYPRPEDAETQVTLIAIRMRKPIEEMNTFHPIQYQSTAEEMLGWFQKWHPYHNWAEAVEASNSIADRCNVALPQMPTLRFSDEPTESRLALFRAKINEGWVKRGIEDPDGRYAERVAYEYDMIVKKDYFDYFLVVSDIIDWALGNDILVGVGRGSAAGSLLCYLLYVTQIDPLKYDLMFERFIDITRPDPPDVDIDFEDRYREDVKNYIRQKYGDECVANLSAYVQFKGKNSLDEIARTEGIPAYEVTKIKSVLVERSSGDSRASFTIEDTCEDFPQAKEVIEKYPVLKKAMSLEGQIKGLTVHAAGMVVCNQPLTNYTAILREGQTCINHKDIAKLNGLKIDVLGISTLSIVHRCAERVGLTIDDLYNLPLDDPLVFKGFNAGLCTNIFQWDGKSTQSVTRQMSQKGGVTNFGHLIDINTLSRPGPLNSGATSKYVDNRPNQIHPLVDELTGSTRGQILYQEQVMMIMRNVGLMDWQDTADIRKLISKKEGVERFNTFWEKFKAGAMSQGFSEPKAQKLWDQVCTFGAYAFNKSHSVSYAMLAYQTMYLKMHHPLEFYWACMVQSPRDIKALKEFMKSGGKVLSVRLGKSKAEWTIEGDALRAGYLSLKGIGDKTAAVIERTGRASGKAREALILAGAFGKDEESDDFLGLRGFEDRLKTAGRSHSIGDLGFEGARLVKVAGVINDRNLRSMEEFTRSIKKSDEKIKDPHLDQWVTLLVEDDTGYIHANINRYDYPKMKSIVWDDFKDGDIYVIKGTKDAGVRRIRVKSIENWSKKHEEDHVRTGHAHRGTDGEQLSLFKEELSAVPRPRTDDGSVAPRARTAVPRTG